MNQEFLVNETVNVLVRVMPSGAIRPTSFLWRDRTYYVNDLGRQWEERVQAKSVRCYLLQTVDNNSFELRWDPAADQWSIYRAWLQSAMV